MSETKPVKGVFLNACVFVGIVILSFGRVNGLSPFSYAFFYGVAIKSAVPVGIIALVITAFFDGIGYMELLFITLSSFPFCIEPLYKKASKKPLPIALRRVFCFINFCLASISFSFTSHPVHIMINAVITLCFSYVFHLSTTMLDSVEKVLSSDTALGTLAFVCVAFGAGFSGIRIFSVPVLFIVAGFCIPFVSFAQSKGNGVVCAIALGVGYAVCYYEVEYIALFGFCALCCVLFTSAKRIFSLLASVMAIITFELYFAVDYTQLLFHALFFLVGGVAFLLTPYKTLAEMRKRRNEVSGSLALRFLINKNRQEVANGIFHLREIFAQMSSALTSLRGNTDKVSLRLAQKTEEEVCKKCDRYKECGQKRLGDALLSLSRLTLIKNKATITELPPLLENECVRLASLVGASYNNSLSIRKEVMRIATQNQVKATLAQSLCGICEILEANGKSVSTPLGFDYEREEKIREELALNGIACKQVYLSLGNDFEVTVLVKSDNYDDERVIKVVSQTLKIPVQITRSDDSVIKGWKVLTLIEKPLFSLVGSVCSSAKQGSLSGDTHSFTKLNEYLALCALCDGMGSGEKAERVSDNALSLIEGFYRAGFSHEVTIKSINSFLRIDNEESFSALDAMIFNSRSGVVDIVKLASPPTYIKKANRTVRVDASSLPLGIVGEISPSVTSRKVEEGDCFVFVSDGVSDCFEGDELSAFINKLSSHNPSLMASSIVEEAKKRKNSPKDDMTALVCKVIINS